MVDGAEGHSTDGHLVRGVRHSGTSRILRRLAQGVVKPLEVEDASPTSAVLLTLQRRMEKVVEKEVARITAKCRRYQEQGKPILAWVRAGMDERFPGVLRRERDAGMPVISVVYIDPGQADGQADVEADESDIL